MRESLNSYLFENEHVVIEKLLKTLIGVINAQLLESVELENFKSCDIENTNEIVPRCISAIKW